MFPGVNGFHWTFGHILFVTIFLTVLLTVAGTVFLAMLRSGWQIRKGRAETIRWKHDFEDLPERDRRCRHELNGEVDDRVCANGFDCRACKDHALFGCAAECNDSDVYGLAYPSGRLYHRGHTWIETQPDGTVLVGLDEIGSRLVGAPDEVELPSVGTRVKANGTGWRMVKAGYNVRILSPVDGEVIETRGHDAGYYLRMKPDNTDFRHLLRGSEVRAWVGRELERLQMAFVPTGAAASLADGGVLMNDLITNLPDAAWDAVLGDVFLEP